MRTLSSDEPVKIVASTIHHNMAAGSGGGISSDDAFMLANSTISANRSDGFGGGVYSRYGSETTLTSVNNTIVDNIAKYQGGGIHCAARLNLQNTILMGNKDTEGNVDDLSFEKEQFFEGKLLNTSDYNIVGRTSNVYEDIGPNTVYVNSDLLFTQLIDSLSDEEGRIPIHNLKVGSIAVDAGYSDFLPTDDFDFDQDGIITEYLPHDIRGFTRINAFSNQLDVGAVESETVFTIKRVEIQRMKEDTESDEITFTIIDQTSSFDPTTISVVSSDQDILPNGNISWSVNNNVGRIRLRPNADRSGTIQVTVIASNQENTTQQTFPIDIEDVNDSPSIVAQKSILTVDEDRYFYLSVDDLEIVDVDNSYSENFQLTVLPGHNYDFQGTEIRPHENFNGTLTIPVLANDGQVYSDTFALVLTVNAVEDRPRLVEDQVFYLTAMDSEGTIGTVVAYDYDGDPLIYEVTWNNDLGIFSIDSLGQLSTNDLVGIRNSSEWIIGIRVTDGKDTYEGHVRIENDLPSSIITSLPGKASNHVRMYPNPTSGRLYIEGSLSNIGQLSILVFNMQGQRILQQTIPTHQINKVSEVDLASLDVGAYLIKIAYGREIYLKKFVKQ